MNNYLLPLLLVFLLPAFSIAQEKISVLATTGMVADVVRQVGGDAVEVQQLIPSNVDPHTYQPTRSDVVAMNRAEMIIYNGLHLEGKMGDILVRMARAKPVYAVTELLSPETLLVADEATDPHVWMDVSKWAQTVQVVQNALSEYRPDTAGAFAANANAFSEELQALQEYVESTLATIPEGQRVMITAHDAFNYMGEAYDLEVYGVQGLSTESEAGLQDINALVTMIVERNVPAVFVETSVADKNVKALIEGAAAKGHEVRLGGTLFSDALGEVGTYEGTYVGMLDHNATVIARALGGEAPAGGMQGKLALGTKDTE